MGKLYNPGDIITTGARRLVSSRPQLLVTRRPAAAVWTNEDLVGDWLAMAPPTHEHEFIQIANENRTWAGSNRGPIRPGRLMWYYISATGDGGKNDLRYFAAHCDIYNSRIERLSRSGEWQDITTEVTAG